jgi:hypothetical protein
VLVATIVGISIGVWMTQSKITGQDLVGIQNAIADLTNSMVVAREETRAGFVDLQGEISDFKHEVRMNFIEIKGDLKVLDSRLKGLEATASKLPDLAEKIGELKNWKQIAIIVFTSSVSGSLAWFLRGSR